MSALPEVILTDADGRSWLCATHAVTEEIYNNLAIAASLEPIPGHRCYMTILQIRDWGDVLIRDLDNPHYYLETIGPFRRDQVPIDTSSLFSAEYLRGYGRMLDLLQGLERGECPIAEAEASPVVEPAPTPEPPPAAPVVPVSPTPSARRTGLLVLGGLGVALVAGVGLYGARQR